jgi:hypothetical protein
MSHGENSYQTHAVNVAGKNDVPARAQGTVKAESPQNTA